MEILDLVCRGCGSTDFNTSNNDYYKCNHCGRKVIIKDKSKKPYTNTLMDTGSILLPTGVLSYSGAYFPVVGSGYCSGKMLDSLNLAWGLSNSGQD